MSPTHLAVSTYVAVPAASPSQSNMESTNEVLTSVKESLKNVMDQRGNVVLSEILVHKFPSASFAVQKSKLNEVQNLHEFFMLVSKCGKSKNNNKHRNSRKTDIAEGQLVSGAKTDMDLSKVHIGKLQCSETWEIFSVKGNEVLKSVALDLMPEGGQCNSYKALIKDLEETKLKLQGLDIHFLLNVLQNAMLSLDLSSEEKQVVQALRICRNTLIHSERVPQLEMLHEAARVLLQALTALGQPSRNQEIEAEIRAILKRLDANNLIEELQKELMCNAPKQDFLQRHFTLPSGQECDMQAMCEQACQHTTVRVEGEVCSGRTSVLLAVYQMWARGDRPLSSYRLVLPLLQQPGAPQLPADPAAATPDELVLHYLRQWTPDILRHYGERAVVSAVGELQGSALALCDSACGYCSGPQWTHGPRIITDWPQQPPLFRPGDVQPASPELRVTLLPLKPRVVDDAVRNWLPQPSTQYILYRQFRDSQLLHCPHALKVFGSVTSRVVRNLDLEMMRALVEHSHSWTSSANPDADKEFFYNLAFRNILSNNTTVDCLSDRCVPAYLVGPRCGPYEFRSLYVEEYCAAMYVARHASSASWIWLRQPMRFHWVFTFVLQIWNEEGTLKDNEKVILNYLSVVLGLYRLKNRNNKQWHAARGVDSTLEQEGFLREGNSKCKLWLFIFHVLESVSGELFAMELVLRHLLQYNCWILDVERFSVDACDDFNRLCRKTVNILKRSASDGSQHLTLPVMKISDKCRDELLDRRAMLLQSLSYFLELGLPVDVKVNQYYNCRDSKYGRPPLVDMLSKGAHGLNECRLNVTTYAGPLALNNLSLKDGGMSALKELRVTVYELSTVHALLQTCPHTLRLLCLSVDLSSRPAGEVASSYLPPPTCAPALSSACYVRLALRYSGSLKLLSHFSSIPYIRVLKLHGLYPAESSEQQLWGGAVLRVQCLMVKFVHRCGSRLSPLEVATWCSRLFSALTCSCPAIQRFIVSRAPAPWTFSSIYDQVLKEVPQLKRLVVQGSVVSPQEALSSMSSPSDTHTSDTRSTLSAPDTCVLELAHSCALQPRLSETQRSYLNNNKPAGLELLIIGVPESPSFPLHWLDAPGSAARISTERTLESDCALAALVRQAYFCRHATFCYEAGSRTLEVLLTTTRDLRLHLSLPHLDDQRVEELCCDAAAASSALLLRVLATAQYLRLQCRGLSAGGFIDLISAVNSVKHRLTVGGSVSPYHVTVLSTQPSSQRRELELQLQLLRRNLPRMSCLNYALFCVVAEGGRVLLAVRKAHNGRIFSDLRS